MKTMYIKYICFDEIWINYIRISTEKYEYFVQKTQFPLIKTRWLDFMCVCI